MIYFIQSGESGPVKIGCSDNIYKRLASLQGANPYKLKLLLTLPGTFKKERNIHTQFSHSHLHGEWFAWTVELSNYIRETQDDLVLAASPHEYPLPFGTSMEDVLERGAPYFPCIPLCTDIGCKVCDRWKKWALMHGLSAEW